jgi:predicted kinase
MMRPRCSDLLEIGVGFNIYVRPEYRPGDNPGAPRQRQDDARASAGGRIVVPILSKDDIKEALFEVLGFGDREHSRRLSDACFAAQLRLAERQLEAGLSCLLEGNWRPEHAGGLFEVQARTGARAAQVWCRASGAETLRRFAARTRHPGHRDSAELAEEVRRTAGQPPAFMDLHGPRWIYDSEQPAAYDVLLRDLKIWRL